MKTLVLLATCLVCTGSLAQTISRDNVADILGFEGAAAADGLPAGWAASPGVTLDKQIFHGGAQSARLDRTTALHGNFSTITVAIPVDFAGQAVELSGYLRAEDVKGAAALWIREDDANGVAVAFQNGESEHFDGTAEWKRFSVSIPVKEEATTLVFGALLSGTGRAWVDDLELLADGEPIAKATSRPALPPSVLDTDREFVDGSRLHPGSLTNLQVENLATLAEVWGFLKYHHPVVAAGERHWDFELFRILPGIISAHTRTERNARLLQWVNSLGPLPPCSPCVKLDTANLQTAPDVTWIRDRGRFGAALSEKLQTIYERRAAGQQFYVKVQPVTGHPEFVHELAYGKIAFPDPGYQLLALFRWWNMMQWWSPNRGLDPGWHAVLRAHIRPIVAAENKQEFAREMMKLIGDAHDSHANLWSSLDQRPPMGMCKVSVVLRFLGRSPVVWSVLDKTSGLERGDVLESIDGRPVAELIHEWLPLYAGSNDAARLRDLARSMTAGECGPARLGIRRAGAVVQIHSLRNRAADPRVHDQGGPVFRLLSKDVAYLRLSGFKAKDAADYVRQAGGTKGLIVDIRNYPSEFAVFSLGQLLVERPTVFVRLARAEPGNPGAFHVKDGPELQPRSPHYGGRVVILVDETSQSQAEYTTMALRTAPGALVAGSQTAGADGDVSNIPLPFGMSSSLSGLGVYTPQGGQTQRIGIARDVEAVPSVAGIAAGRDEVLEVALRQILGGSVPQSEIEQMARR